MTETAADAITAVAVTTAVTTAGGFPAGTIPAAISCGSSFCCVCAEITDADAATDAAAETTAGLSLYCFCFAETAADADADNRSAVCQGESLPPPGKDAGFHGRYRFSFPTECPPGISSLLFFCLFLFLTHSISIS